MTKLLTSWNVRVYTMISTLNMTRMCNYETVIILKTLTLNSIEIHCVSCTKEIYATITYILIKDVTKQT